MVVANSRQRARAAFSCSSSGSELSSGCSDYCSSVFHWLIGFGFFDFRYVKVTLTRKASATMATVIETLGLTMYSRCLWIYCTVKYVCNTVDCHWSGSPLLWWLSIVPWPETPLLERPQIMYPLFYNTTCRKNIDLRSKFIRSELMLTNSIVARNLDIGHWNILQKRVLSITNCLFPAWLQVSLKDHSWFFFRKVRPRLRWTMLFM